MGLINFWGQKSKLDELQDDLANMKLYVTHVSGCIAEIDACWIGNKDKQKVVNAISSHLHLVNKSNSNLNTFKQTATFVLIKMNELGSLVGLMPPFVSQICLPGICSNLRLNPKIQINTTILKLVADKIEGERKHLDNTSFAINSTKNIIDNIILNLFGLNNLLRAIDKDVAEQKLENQRIVSGIRQICDLYESTENRLKKKIEALAGLGTATVVDPLVPTPTKRNNDGVSKTIVHNNGTGTYPINGCIPATAQYTNNLGERSASAYNAIIDQFAVTSNERYAIKGNNTYCNIFAWDVTSAMGAEIPHWVDRTSGEPREYPNTSGAYELNADGGKDWLNNYGPTYGWHKISANEAQELAQKGQPTVATGNGHIQVVRPTKEGDIYNASQGPYVAQAGLNNFDYDTTVNGMGTLDSVEYFTHD